LFGLKLLDKSIYIIKEIFCDNFVITFVTIDITNRTQPQCVLYVSAFFSRKNLIAMALARAIVYVKKKKKSRVVLNEVDSAKKYSRGIISRNRENLDQSHQLNAKRVTSDH